MKRCAADCQKAAALLHKNDGYCVWHYRVLPDSLLRMPWVTP